ncbi:MAG: energy transducer TonB [Burkholderiales bacterium]
MPTGEVLDAKLAISSGHTAYDDAVLRAILKSSPLPKPDTAGLFERELKLTFHPKD